MKKIIAIGTVLLILSINVKAIKVRFTVANMSVNVAEGSIGVFASFQIYPNPAKEVVYIDYSNVTTTLAIFTLYDLTGRIVKTKTYNAQNGDSPTFGLSVNELKAGTYFYTLQVGEKSYNGKVVKMGY